MSTNDSYYKLAEEVIEKLADMTPKEREEFFALVSEDFCVKCGSEVDGATCWECKDIDDISEEDF